ncbi:hypothetical protein PM082_012708 [Marasmius tenuissimus]|nr:hypothetical protein PM082_012708 [Marasmius tenuissimus]
MGALRRQREYSSVQKVIFLSICRTSTIRSPTYCYTTNVTRAPNPTKIVSGKREFRANFSGNMITTKNSMLPDPSGNEAVPPRRRASVAPGPATTHRGQ